MANAKTRQFSKLATDTEQATNNRGLSSTAAENITSLEKNTWRIQILENIQYNFNTSKKIKKS